jgi:phage I-like protein
MQAREDGIWGRVEWTEAGRALRAEGAYRGISPVFEHTASGTVVLIRNAALTNTPNLTQLATLHDQAGHDTTHNQETEMDITELRRALGVDAATDDAGVIAAAVAAVTQRAEHSRAAEMQLTALQTQVSALTSQVAEMTTAEKRARAEGYIDGAIRAGKPILVGRETLIAQHMADPVGTETLVDGMPSINTGGAVLPPTTTAVMDAEDGDPLTSEEMATAKAMGIDPKEKARAKRLKRLGRADEIGKKAVK